MNNPSEDEYTWVWIYNQNISRDTVITLSVLYGNGSSSDSIGSVSISKNITYELLILEFGVNLKQTILVRL